MTTMGVTSDQPTDPASLGDRTGKISRSIAVNRGKDGVSLLTSAEVGSVMGSYSVDPEELLKSGGFHVCDLELDRPLDSRNPADLRIIVGMVGDCPEKEVVEAHMCARDHNLDPLVLEKRERILQTKLTSLKVERSRIERMIDWLRERKEDVSKFRQHMRAIADKINAVKEQLRKVREHLTQVLTAPATATT